MATQAVRKPASEQPLPFEQRVQKLREIYADATEISKTALENVIRAVQVGRPRHGIYSDGKRRPHRRPSGQGFGADDDPPLKPGGEAHACVFGDVARRLGNQGVDKVGTVHDMRFVFLDNDTKLLFCTAYDGDWDPYIDDFAPRSPTSWTFSSAKSKAGREFAARR